MPHDSNKTTKDQNAYQNSALLTYRNWVAGYLSMHLKKL